MKKGLIYGSKIYKSADLRKGDKVILECIWNNPPSYLNEFVGEVLFAYSYSGTEYAVVIWPWSSRAGGSDDHAGDHISLEYLRFYKPAEEVFDPVLLQEQDLIEYSFGEKIKSRALFDKYQSWGGTGEKILRVWRLDETGEYRLIFPKRQEKE